LIEDVAEAPFAKRDGHQAGELGDIATFSFFGNKIISSGEGGAVTTSNQELLMKMKILRSQGMDPNTRYFFSEIGFNYRLTNVAAAILVGQLERLSEMWERRMLLYSSYKEVLQKFDFLELQNVEENEVVSPWLFPVLLDSETRRNTIMARLLDCGIDSRPFFIPVHSLPMYRSIPIRGDMKITDDIAYRGMNLPTSSAFSELEIQTLLIGIQKVFEDE
jgi:perosamine synthetase